MKNKWDERYSSDEYVYGTEPNQFFKNEIDKLAPGKILFLGEGEGRNAVYAASLGWDVDAVDSSIVGKEKAIKLGASKGVEINYVVADLNEYAPQPGKYDAVVIIYLHLPEPLRKKVFKEAAASLAKGGKIIFESYDKDQLKYNSGGPKNPDLLYSLEDIYTDFHELDIEKFSKELVEINEGKYHGGVSAVIRYVGVV